MIFVVPDDDTKAICSECVAGCAAILMNRANSIPFPASKGAKKGELKLSLELAPRGSHSV